MPDLTQKKIYVKINLYKRSGFLNDLHNDLRCKK